MPWEINLSDNDTFMFGPSFSSALEFCVTECCVVHSIQVPYTDFFWNVAADAPHTRVCLALLSCKISLDFLLQMQIALAKKDGTTGQKWIPCATLPGPPPRFTNV
jgi:hypothetical protein